VSLPDLKRVRMVLGIDERYPDSNPTNLPRLHKARARRRAASKVAKQSRKRNRA
jgi:hypothetical protein